MLQEDYEFEFDESGRIIGVSTLTPTATANTIDNTQDNSFSEQYSNIYYDNVDYDQNEEVDDEDEDEVDLSDIIELLQEEFPYLQSGDILSILSNHLQLAITDNKNKIFDVNPFNRPDLHEIFQNVNFKSVREELNDIQYEKMTKEKGAKRNDDNTYGFISCDDDEYEYESDLYGEDEAIIDITKRLQNQSIDDEETLMEEWYATEDKRNELIGKLLNSEKEKSPINKNRKGKKGKKARNKQKKSKVEVAKHEDEKENNDPISDSQSKLLEFKRILDTDKNDTQTQPQINLTIPEFDSKQNSNLDFLINSFPKTDIVIIKFTFQQNNYNIEQTIDDLLFFESYHKGESNNENNKDKWTFVKIGKTANNKEENSISFDTPSKKTKKTKKSKSKIIDKSNDFTNIKLSNGATIKLSNKNTIGLNTIRKEFLPNYNDSSKNSITWNEIDLKSNELINLLCIKKENSKSILLKYNNIIGLSLIGIIRFRYLKLKEQQQQINSTIINNDDNSFKNQIYDLVIVGNPEAKLIDVDFLFITFRILSHLHLNDDKKQEIVFEKLFKILTHIIKDEVQRYTKSEIWNKFIHIEHSTNTNSNTNTNGNTNTNNKTKTRPKTKILQQSSTINIKDTKFSNGFQKVSYSKSNSNSRSNLYPISYSYSNPNSEMENEKRILINNWSHQISRYPKKSDSRIDLHGISYRLAMEAIQEILIIWWNKEKENRDHGNYTTLTIITGKGLHSENGIGKISSGVYRTLTRLRFNYDIPEGGGCYTVYDKKRPK